MSEQLRGRVVTPDSVIDDGIVEVDGPKIIDVSPSDVWAQRHGGSSLPQPQGTVLPGLVDIHCHGGGGAAFPTTDKSETATAAEHHHRNGTTSVMASLVTAAPADLTRQLTALAALVGDGTLAGVHLEGPFLATECCGAQNPALIIDPDLDVTVQLIDVAGAAISMVTLAPERPGYADVATALRQHDIAVALGHSNADYDTFAAAIGTLDGDAIVTHLANGMPPFHHRSGGPVGASLVSASVGDATLELIADGQHVDAGFIRLAFATAGPDRVALVTDAMAAAGMPDGEYDLGGQRVVVRDGAARLATADGSPGSIAGGTSHLIENVARCVDAGVPLADAVRAASITPARAVGLSGTLGALSPGLYADVVVADERLAPRRVMRRGEWL